MAWLSTHIPQRTIPIMSSQSRPFELPWSTVMIRCKLEYCYLTTTNPFSSPFPITGKFTSPSSPYPLPLLIPISDPTLSLYCHPHPHRHPQSPIPTPSINNKKQTQIRLEKESITFRLLTSIPKITSPIDLCTSIQGKRDPQRAEYPSCFVGMMV